MSAPEPSQAGRCPVCRARYRGARACARCGADLAPLMSLELAAAAARAAARDALERGDAVVARERATAAQRLCATRAGKGLAVLARWLACRERQES